MTTVVRRVAAPTDLPRPAGRYGWWLLLAVCSFYGVFAVALGLVEVLSWTGTVDDAQQRAVPIAFVLHAFAGGIALVAGALQFNSRLRARRPAVHRRVGRTYVAAVWVAAVGGLWSAVFFDVGPAARAAFVVAASLWFTTTTVALLLIRRRDVPRHREWMIRSFALSMFFVTFEFWTSGLRASGLAEPVAYPLGLVLAWSVNLAVAEARIRRSRTPSGDARLRLRLRLRLPRFR
jgi:uncharacterized membrane protein